MNWIGIITNLLTAVNVIICLLIVLLVLLQRPKNEGLGAAFGGDTASNIFGAQTTNVLATLTRWLGALFLVLCLVIAVLGTHDSKRKGITEAFLLKQKQEQAERDKQKAAEEAAKSAAAAVEAAKNPSSATTPPVQVPQLGTTPAPVPPSPESKPDAKPAEGKPAEPTVPVKPAEPKPPVPAPSPSGN